MARVGDARSGLAVITSSALMIPALQDARADAPPTFTQLGLRYGQYREDDNAGSNTFGGRQERMEVDSLHFSLVAPVAADWALFMDIDREEISGASPWFVGQTAEGASKVFMSGPSIRDTRTAVSVTTRYYLPRGNAGLNYSHSEEDDYQSDAVALDGAVNSADGLTTYSAAVSYADDRIEPTQGATPTDVKREEKQISSLWGGVSQIISAHAVVRFGLSFSYRDGYLTDPYKARDSRPDSRREWALSAGYRHALPRHRAAVHVDYRLFDDDWGVQSHTLDLAWHQRLAARWQLAPYGRYYSQRQADFFSNGANEGGRYFADDHRLSSFGAISLGLRVSYDLGDWTISLDGERYRSNGSWGIYGGEESPALVDAWRMALGLDLLLD